MTIKPSDSVNMIETPDEQDPNLDSLPFMDTFYALSSDEVYERTLAASSLLRHLFSQNNSEPSDDSREIALIEDGQYAFTRLLQGLCSGRASARQGYASCLSTFLELSFKLGPVPAKKSSPMKCWMECYMEKEDASCKSLNAKLSPSEFVRNQLMKHTVESGDQASTVKGTRRGSEERDRKYGTLFGILAVIKSGTIFQRDSSMVMKRYVSDLLSLYEYKKWIREPSMHALQELVSAIYENSGLETLTVLVDNQLPSFFDSKHHTWTAEKISIYVHLQTIYMNAKINCSDIVLPKTLRTPLLTSSALKDGTGAIATTLKDTSSAVYPRCHLVWNTIWSYLTLPTVTQSDSSHEKRRLSKKNDISTPTNISVPSFEGRKLRDVLMLGDESSEDIVKSLVDGVISASILRTQCNLSINGTSEEVLSTETNIITHERRALALMLVHQLCTLHLPSTLLEQVVLQPSIVTKLFLHTLARGKTHKTMKPLATHFLNQIVECVTGGRNIDLASDSSKRRLSVIKALIKADPAFDSVSQTDTIASLLGLKSNTDAMGGIEDELLFTYLSFLKEQVLIGNRSPEMTKKYIGLIYSLASHVLKVGSIETREKILRSVLSFLMVGGLFDTRKIVLGGSKSKKKKTSHDCEFLAAAHSIQKHLQKGEASSAFPYVVRAAMSSRFFTLLSDATSATHLSGRGQALRSTKMKYTLKIFDFVRLGWSKLENSGGVPFERKIEKNCDMKFSATNSKKERESIIHLLKAVASADENTTKMRAVSGIVSLALALIIQLLNPGGLESTEESDWKDLDEDESNDTAEDVQDLIMELLNIADAINENQSDVNSCEEDNPNGLVSLAAVCVEILTLPIRDGSAGKLIRSLTNTAWITGLSVIDIESSPDAFIIDKEVMTIILESVCGEMVMPVEDENDADSHSMEEEEEEVFGFSKYAAPMDLDNVSNTSDDNEAETEVVNDSSDDEDVQLDPSSLENLLLEDSDTEERDLEHHAGADSALAQLIKMRQISRKAGKDEREKVEVVHKLRCMVLLEAIFTRGNTLSQKIVMMSICPLLRARRELDNSVASLTKGKKKSASSINEKRAILSRMSVLLQKKITKLDVNDESQVKDHHSTATTVMEELKKCSTPMHHSCCSALLIMMVKGASQNFDRSVIIVKDTFEGAVKEWSTKRKTKLPSSIFVDLIRQVPSVSRVVLLKPLAIAAKDARTPFLKSESFHMISSLYNTIKTDGAEKNSAEISALDEAIPIITAAITTEIPKTDFSKAKRARHVLQTIENIIAYGQSRKNNLLWSNVAVMGKSLDLLSNNTKSAAIKNACTKLQNNISEGISR